MPIAPDADFKAFVTPGQRVQVRILQIEASRQRLGLSMKIE
jgi:ribosomal protein S1